MQNLKNNWSVVSKMTRNWWNSTRLLESLQILHFHYIQRGYLSWNCRVTQNLKKKWLAVWKMKWGIWQMFTEHLKTSKLGLWWDPLIQSRKSVSLKFTEELCVVTMKKDAKFEEELTCRFKTDMRNLTDFDPSIWMSQKSSFYCAAFEQSIYCLS